MRLRDDDRQVNEEEFLHIMRKTFCLSTHCIPDKSSKTSFPNLKRVAKSLVGQCLVRISREMIGEADDDGPRYLPGGIPPHNGKHQFVLSSRHFCPKMSPATFPSQI